MRENAKRLPDDDVVTHRRGEQSGLEDSHRSHESKNCGNPAGYSDDVDPWNWPVEYGHDDGKHETEDWPNQEVRQEKWVLVVELPRRQCEPPEAPTTNQVPTSPRGTFENTSFRVPSGDTDDSESEPVDISSFDPGDVDIAEMQDAAADPARIHCVMELDADHQVDIRTKLDTSANGFTVTSLMRCSPNWPSPISRGDDLHQSKQCRCD